ncbi:ATP-binding protein [Daejeonella oryzae]|uniref:ATP-binding protein n=1 Tax=Daejeonella oryzae TaxID=1122943 RepID=UPI00041BBCF9|nr:ATP-binding protein [Daejeonella oryzae]
MDNDLGFKPKARLILQLGDQLIRSEGIALLEVIKNSYDACASRVNISLSNLDNKQFGQIVIEDDGFGMDYNLIRGVWLQPGTTFKKNQIEDKKFVSPCNRMPLGEKGIGRFGVHKLGEEIELISKTKESKEAYLKIDWNDFDNDLSLDKIPINLIEREPIVFSHNGHGTKIIIKNLRTTWTRGSVRELYRAVNSLNSPFESINSFKVLFKIDRQEWLSGLLKFKEIEDSALFSADITIRANQITQLDYKFTPYGSMTDLRERVHSEVNIEMVQKVYDERKKKKVIKDIDISHFKIGEIKIKMLIFDFDTNILSLGVADRKGLKDYLKLNGGMRVYRDGIRVYDYGEPGNDWLSLDIDRVNLPTARISNNIVIGAIQLSRIESKDLIEKTNREGFLQNDAYDEFFKAIHFTISRVITQRNIDKDKLRSHYSGKSKKVPVVDNLDFLREKVQSLIPDTLNRSEILGIIDEIAADYKTISDVYIRSASAGLSLSIVIHEIEKIIQELLYVVEDASKPNSGERVKALTWHLGKLVDGYSGLIRRRSRKESDLKKIIANALWNVEYRLKAHEVEIISAFENEKTFKTKVKCSESLITGTIINIIDNSIYWMNFSKVQNKKIFVDLTEDIDGYITILIADNGPGFTIPYEDAIKPFISNKEDGIGIGLHIADEIMKSNGGELLFLSVDKANIKENFNAGAILGLGFRLSQK